METIENQKNLTFRSRLRFQISGFLKAGWQFRFSFEQINYVIKIQVSPISPNFATSKPDQSIDSKTNELVPCCDKHLKKLQLILLHIFTHYK